MTGNVICESTVTTNTGEIALGPIRLDDSFDTGYLSYLDATPSESGTGAGNITWNDVGPLLVGEPYHIGLIFRVLPRSII